MPAMTVTLTTHGVVYNLYTLIKATYPNAAGACREMNIAADPGNASAKVYVGGNNVSSSNFGEQLTAGQSLTYRSDLNNVPICEKGLVSDTDGAKVDVDWSYA